MEKRGQAESRDGVPFTCGRDRGMCSSGDGKMLAEDGLEVLYIAPS